MAPVLGYFTAARQDDLSGFQTGAAADTDRFEALLAAQVQVDQLRASTYVWWGARLLFLVGAFGPVVHLTAVFLDSVPLFGHAVGSWAVPRLPAPYDADEGQVVLSFFILAPVSQLSRARGRVAASERLRWRRSTRTASATARTRPRSGRSRAGINTAMRRWNGWRWIGATPAASGSP